jgi:hypothetical protein
MHLINTSTVTYQCLLSPTIDNQHTTLHEQRTPVFSDRPEHSAGRVGAMDGHSLVPWAGLSGRMESRYVSAEADNAATDLECLDSRSQDCVLSFVLCRFLLGYPF